MECTTASLAQVVMNEVDIYRSRHRRHNKRPAEHFKAGHGLSWNQRVRLESYNGLWEWSKNGRRANHTRI